MEIKFGSLQKTIFEIIEIEEYTLDIELGLRIAMGEIETAGTTELHIGQLTDGTLEQFLFLDRITASSLTTATDGIEERQGTQVGLQIAQLVATDGQHLWHGQLSLGEMASQIDESMVFVTTGTDTPDDRTSLFVGHAIIHPVAACTR